MRFIYISRQIITQISFSNRRDALNKQQDILFQHQTKTAIKTERIAHPIRQMNAMLRGGTNNNGCNYTSTKGGERGSIEGDEPGGAISTKTRYNADFDPEVTDAEYNCARRKIFEIVRKKNHSCLICLRCRKSARERKQLIVSATSS